MGTALDDVKAGRQFDTWLRAEMEDDAPCEWEECDAGAEWKVTLKCCGHTVLMCDPHHARSVDVLNSPRRLVCRRCEAPVMPDRVVWTRV